MFLGLTNIMAESTDYDEKLLVWQKWRDQVNYKTFEIRVEK